jgi:hypothetical protein
LHHGDHLNHHGLVNLHGGDLYLDLTLDVLKKVYWRDARMKKRMKKRKVDWMGAMNSREVFFHPFQTPLFKF